MKTNAGLFLRLNKHSWSSNWIGISRVCFRETVWTIAYRGMLYCFPALRSCLKHHSNCCCQPCRYLYTTFTGQLVLKKRISGLPPTVYQILSMCLPARNNSIYYLSPRPTPSKAHNNNNNGQKLEVNGSKFVSNIFALGLVLLGLDFFSCWVVNKYPQTRSS